MLQGRPTATPEVVTPLAHASVPTTLRQSITPWAPPNLPNRSVNVPVTLPSAYWIADREKFASQPGLRPTAWQISGPPALTVWVTPPANAAGAADSNSTASIAARTIGRLMRVPPKPKLPPATGCRRCGEAAMTSRSPLSARSGPGSIADAFTSKGGWAKAIRSILVTRPWTGRPQDAGSGVRDRSRAGSDHHRLRIEAIARRTPLPLRRMAPGMSSIRPTVSLDREPDVDRVAVISRYRPSDTRMRCCASLSVELSRRARWFGTSPR